MVLSEQEAEEKKKEESKNQMSLKIFADRSLIRSLSRVLFQFGNGAEENADLDLTVIQAEMGPIRSNLCGLDLILDVAREDTNPIILMSEKSRVFLADDIRWHAALGYPHVGFIETKNVHKIKALLPPLLGRSRPSDLVAIDLARFRAISRIIRTLRQEMFTAKRSEAEWKKWLSKARQHLGLRVENEILGIVERELPSEMGLFSGKFLPGVYIDVENILVRYSVVDTGLRDRIVSMGQSLPITLWHDNISEIDLRRLRKAGLFHKVLPKSLFFGATVQIAYCDLEEGRFSESCNVRAKEYCRIV